MAEATLHERLGGERKIRKIATSIFDNHAKNSVIRARYGSSDRNEVIRLVTEFLMIAYSLRGEILHV